MLKMGIVGASGYTGAEMMRLVASHPDISVVVGAGESTAGLRVADLYNNLAPAYSEMVYEPYDAGLFAGLDVVVMGLPHGTSQPIVSELYGRVGLIADMGADFRLKDPALYPEWYGDTHSCPELLDKFVYGLPELYRDQIVGAKAIAVPGCNPTAACLALAPFSHGNLLDGDSVIVDLATGASGAGRGPKPKMQFCAVDENYEAYGLLDHRHTPEMEQVLNTAVLFTPHLAPMSRGVLATCYAQPAVAMTTEQALVVMADFYADEPFVVVDERSPSTKATLGSNSAHLTARVDPRTGRLIAIAAIDNLTKGSAGGALQAINIALGLDETAGLPTLGLLP